MTLPRHALRYRSIVLAIVFVSMVWGVISFGTLPRREDPEYTVRACQVTTSWPGATALDMELLVVDPLEKAIGDLDEVDEIDSRSLVGYSSITVTLLDEIAPETVDIVWDKIRAKVAAVPLPFDDGCEAPYVNADYGDTGAMVLAVYQRVDDEDAASVAYTPREMEIIADRLEDQIKAIPDVAMSELHGVQQEVIYLETDPGTWSQLAMTSDRLAELLAQRNIVAPGGSIETELARFGVKPSGEFKADREIYGLVVGTHASQAPVYLRDLGIDVVRTYEDPPKLIARYGDASGRRPTDSIVIWFTMKDGRNITRLGDEIVRLLDRAKAAWLPDDIEVALVSDQPTSVRTKINDFTLNLVEAVAIVVVVAYLLVGIRVAIVMAAAIPLVMLSSMGMMPLFGVQLEQISIAALIIALGMLVDNAIEVCDNTHRLLEEGKDRLEAAAEGAGQIGFPILIATLTTMAAFLPMLTLPGSSGEYVYSLPVVVSATLAISWLLAMTMTTLMAYWLIKPAAGKAPLWLLTGWVSSLVRRLLRRPASGGGVAFGALFDKAAMAAIRRKYLAIAVAFGCFFAACSLVVTGKVGTQYFPAADRSQFVIDIDLPEGSPIALTLEAGREVERILEECRWIAQGDEKVNALDNYVGYIGGGGPRFYMSLDPKEPGPNNGFYLVNTTNTKLVIPYLKAVREAARQRIPGARISPKRLDMGPPVEFPVQLRVSGPGISELRGISAEVEQILRETPGAWDVHDTWGRRGFQLDAVIDEDRAKLAGVTNAAVAQTLNAFFSGHHLTTYREGDHNVPVYLRLSPERRADLADVAEVYVEGAYGKVPIDAVAEMSTTWVPAKIERFQQRRTIEVNARVREGMLANAVLAAAWDRIEQVRDALPVGYDIEIGGEQEETTDSQAYMRKALFISLLAIVILLVIMYNSLVKPAIILITLPLATTGALIGLWVNGQPLGFMASLGLLALAGIVINAAIVLIEFVALRIREHRLVPADCPAQGQRSYCGLTREAFRLSLVEGARMRILPIMLTTLTTAGGMLPLALAGGPLFEPIATVIIFGLLLATALTLLVIPAVLAIFVELFGIDLASEPD